ncbi:Soluble lytic murein transglycosylase and related regulatory proteins (some containing LysM/invasin domains) [Mesorhizobium sp. J18]|nr:Soluble lytic murein transglycosylase and related regulatory proteins (some containing LysM/invasin domains) [Mesorhizobium sp. J18]
MKISHGWLCAALAAAALSGCTSAGVSLPDVMDITPSSRPEISSGSGLDGMISHYAAAYQVPESLVHRVVKRESSYNPKAYNSGNYGLMQIRYKTAQGMGYKGKPSGLFDAETNLKYAVKYLRGAYIVADGNHDQAVRLYARGYYYDAKRKGLLEETGLRPGKKNPETATAVASVKQETKPEQTVAAAKQTPPGVSAPVQAAAAIAPAETASMAFAGSTPTSGSSVPVPGFRPSE